MIMVSSHLGSDWPTEGEAGVINSHDSHHDGEDDDESKLVVDAGYSGMPSTMAPHRVRPLLSQSVVSGLNTSM